MSGLRGKAAIHAMKIKTEGMLEPLLEKDEDLSSSSSDSDESSQYSADSSTVSINVKPSMGERLKAGAVYLGMGVGSAASVAAMVFQPVAAVFIMAAVKIINVPYAAYKEHRIMKLPALRNLNNKLREDAVKLEEGVDDLAAEIDYLQPEATRASAVEEELKNIAAEQHYNVDKLVNLVRENEEIIQQMRINLRHRIVQDIIQIVMSSDKNNDGKFCKVETKMLVLKISVQLQEYGVDFDEAKFYRVMSKDPSVAQTIKIVKRLVPGLAGEDESIGLEDEDDDIDEDTYDMFHMATDTSVGRRSSSLGLPQGLSLSVSKDAFPASPGSRGRSSEMSQFSALSAASGDSPLQNRRKDSGSARSKGSRGEKMKMARSAPMKVSTRIARESLKTRTRKAKDKLKSRFHAEEEV